MNWRSKVVATATALMMLGGGLAPALADGESAGTSGSVGVTENGTFEVTFNYQNVAFPGTSVNTKAGGGTLTSNEIRFYVQDRRATSPGWTLTLTASDFTTPGSTSTIQAKNLVLTQNNIYQGQYQESCFHGLDPNPTNQFQTITKSGVNQALGNDNGPVGVQVLTGTPGRGCGDVTTYMKFQLTVPAGTYTGGDSTTYTSQLKVTESAAPTGT